MTKCEKFICEWVAEFVEQNWDKIDHKKCDLDQTTKEKFLKDVKTKPQDAMWVITEVMNWAMDKNYFKELEILPKLNLNTEEETRVIKLGEKYIKWAWNKDFTYSMKFTKPKRKTITVEYFE